MYMWNSKVWIEEIEASSQEGFKTERASLRDPDTRWIKIAEYTGIARCTSVIQAVYECRRLTETAVIQIIIARVDVVNAPSAPHDESLTNLISQANPRLNISSIQIRNVAAQTANT